MQFIEKLKWNIKINIMFSSAFPLQSVSINLVYKRTKDNWCFEFTMSWSESNNRDHFLENWKNRTVNWIWQWLRTDFNHTMICFALLGIYSIHNQLLWEQMWHSWPEHCSVKSRVKPAQAVFSQAWLSRLTFLKVFCLLTSLSDLKMIGVFTSKIVFHLSNLRRARARIN